MVKVAVVGVNQHQRALIYATLVALQESGIEIEDPPSAEFKLKQNLDLTSAEKVYQESTQGPTRKRGKGKYKRWSK